MSILTLSRTTATLKRKPTTVTKDASGGMVMTYAVVSGYSGVPCDIQPASENVRLQYMQRQTQVTHTIYSESDIPAMAEDILVADDRTFQFRGRKPQPPGYDLEWPAEIHVEEQLG